MLLTTLLPLGQRYVKRIHELDQEIWRKITYTQLESELLRLKQSLEDTYTAVSISLQIRHFNPSEYQ